jgi:predicted transcriptional regulator
MPKKKRHLQEPIVFERSKFEMCLDILETVAKHRSLQYSPTELKTKHQCRAREKFNATLEFLRAQFVIQERRTRDGQKCFLITERGMRILTYFKFAPDVLWLADLDNLEAPAQRFPSRAGLE